ncbi:MAG: aminoacyl-histidine dipeptidase [Planctomycetota bacterium]
MSKQRIPSAFASLEPAPVWRFFADLAAVPRPSKHEERIRRHIKKVAQKNGLKLREDRAGNQVIEVPASRGCERAPITVLQGHLDMVCEKNAATDHDFDREPIKLLVEDDPKDGQQIVRADGTTLGADNGIGVAMALAAACSPDVVHGPLELLFTVDEEAGMSGAKALAPDLFHGRRLLNLDSEEDHVLYIGCAGGCDTTLSWTWDVRPPAKGVETCRVVVEGLCGGHSGGDIHKNRGNAIKLLVRTLRGTRSKRLQIAALNGGSKRNVIPREAAAVLAGPAGTFKALQQAAARVRDEAAGESAEDHPVLRVEKVPRKAASPALSSEDTQHLLAILAALPQGVLGLHGKIDRLVETSNNVAIVATSPNERRGAMNVSVGTLSRSSSPSQMHVILRQIAAVGQLAGAEVATGNEYPGWEPNMNSPLLGTCRTVYAQLFGEPPNVTAIHAGLECGIIGQRVGGMDMISFGPHITGAHSPDEQVYVASVQKTWRYLRAVLMELARG